ncbi:hypothetical protein [Thermoflavimicrobium daqui]|nr:hypothetical protein [Thermoflavimicrobium daqui]
MIFRRDPSLICMIGIFTIALVATESLIHSVGIIFYSFVYTLRELLGTVMIVCVIVAMSRVLTDSGVNEVMIRPITKWIRTPSQAYWIIGFTMMVASFFFWPSPAVAFIGAIMLPVALKAGLPALGVAITMNLFGHGVALSGDFIIQAIPSLTAKASGLTVEQLVSASIPLVVMMGVITTVVAYFLIMKETKSGGIQLPIQSLKKQETEQKKRLNWRVKLLAVSIPILFLLDIIAMRIYRLKGEDATALLGGTALLIVIITICFCYQEKRFQRITEYLLQGFKFGFTVFGAVIPIAAFFSLGGSGIERIMGNVLPTTSQGIVNDLGAVLAYTIPFNESIGVLASMLVGVITGLDGSGFSGLSLVGSTAKLFAMTMDANTAQFAALGQIAAIWVGGGTIIPWALIPVAAICGIDPIELARRNLFPVLIGLCATTGFVIILG